MAASYPTVMSLAFALFWASSEAGAPLILAAYGAALFAAPLVTLHEIKLPYRRSWRPSAGEIRADALFMLAVQAALPYLLSITLGVGLAQWVRHANVPSADLWLHHWPLPLQVALALLIAELPRYWLHRAFHRWPVMWALHAVHHSPHRLYWLNVGRSHPLEKSMLFVVDTLPLVLLGVSDAVLGAFFVFYAVNGFYQHSNCKVRLGVLNHIVAGPELHRWHHAERKAEADHNFGNNLIVWDTLFGTRYSPKDRQVGQLGLADRNYPLGFFGAIAAPFKQGVDPG